jgi:hypothetical protein
MKKSIIALFALTSSYVYAAETVGTIISIQPAETIEFCGYCSLQDMAVYPTTDMDNNIIAVKTPNNNIYTFKVESKYALKVGQSVDIIVDENIKDNVANSAQAKFSLAAK